MLNNIVCSFNSFFSPERKKIISQRLTLKNGVRRILLWFSCMCLTDLCLPPSVGRWRPALQVQMWNHHPCLTADWLSYGVGRSLAQRPAGGQLLLAEADPGRAASGVRLLS